MTIPITGEKVWHEAGHTVMFTCYGIPIQYVSVRPDLANSYAGMVVPAVNEPESGKEELEKWMRCAAAGEAAERYGYGRGMRSDAKLREIFELTIDFLAENSDPSFHHDLLNFVNLASVRDEEVEPDLAGPSGWVAIWQEAEELIRGQLWPAVEAVFQKLWSIVEANNGKPPEEMPNLDGGEAVEIVRAALPPGSPCAC
jgi:hypothetical protein